MKVGKATILSILSVFAFTLTIIGCDTQITNPLITAAVDELSEPTSTGEVKLSSINPDGEIPPPAVDKLSEPTPVGEVKQPGADLFDRIPPPVTDFFISADQMSVEPSKDPNDFVGRIYAPNPEGSGIRSDAQPVTGVTVRIMSGTRSGECVTTDKGGFYLFPDMQEDGLHLLAEKEHFESKEVIVHRFRPTQPANCAVPNYPGDIQRHPGNIIIGQRWPDEVRSLLEEMFLPYDLLYIEGKVPPEGIRGYYAQGVVATFFHYYGDWQEFIPSLLEILAHEIAHAHQHAVVSVDGSGHTLDWVDTPEGIAFMLAREKDWKEVGKTELFDHSFERFFDGKTLMLENAATALAYYWNFKQWGWVESLDVGNLKITAPNRFKWAEEWFGR